MSCMLSLLRGNGVVSMVSCSNLWDVGEFGRPRLRRKQENAGSNPALPTIFLEIVYDTCKCNSRDWFDYYV